MESKANPFVVAFVAGVIAGAVFLIAFLGFLFSTNDAQNAIGLFLSPFLAAWFGVSVGLIVLGYQLFSRPIPDGSPLAIVGPIAFCLGLVGVAAVVAFVGRELVQATHPTCVDRNHPRKQEI